MGFGQSKLQRPSDRNREQGNATPGQRANAQIQLLDDVDEEADEGICNTVTGDCEDSGEGGQMADDHVEEQVDVQALVYFNAQTEDQAQLKFPAHSAFIGQAGSHASSDSREKFLATQITTKDLRKQVLDTGVPTKSSVSAESYQLKRKQLMTFADMGDVKLPEHRWSEACTESLRKAICELQNSDKGEKKRSPASAPRPKLRNAVLDEKIAVMRTDGGRSERRHSILSSLKCQLVAIPENESETENPDEYEYSEMDVYF